MLRHLLTSYIVLRDRMDIVGILRLLTCIDCPCLAIWIKSTAWRKLRMTGPLSKISAVNAGLLRVGDHAKRVSCGSRRTACGCRLDVVAGDRAQGLVELRSGGDRAHVARRRVVAFR